MDLSVLTALLPRLGAMLALLLASAFFSGSESALFSLSRVQRERLKGSDEAGERYVMRLLENPRRLIASILICNELVNVTFTVLVAGVARRVLPGWSQVAVAAVATGIAVPLLLLLGEITPKSIGLRVAEGWAALSGRLIGLFAWLVAPARLVITAVAGLLVRLLGGKPTGSGPRPIDADEFKAMVEAGSKEGELEAEERRLIHNVFEFRDRTAGEIMTSGKKVFSLSIDLPLARMAAEAARSGFSRIPVYRGRRDTIIGILFAKDLLGHSTGRLAGKGVKELLRAPVYVPRTTRCDSLFREFQRTRTHMGLVVDEYGRLAGLITMEDLLVELFGEIREEKQRRAQVIVAETGEVPKIEPEGGGGAL
jgi:putative hemolysin